MKGVKVRVFNVTIMIFQLYHGSQFYWWRKLEYLEKPTDQQSGSIQNYKLRTSNKFLVERLILKDVIAIKIIS
jgi:hypothetical protein